MFLLSVVHYCENCFNTSKGAPYWSLCYRQFIIVSIVLQLKEHLTDVYVIGSALL